MLSRASKPRRTATINGSIAEARVNIVAIHFDGPTRRRNCVAALYGAPKRELGDLAAVGGHRPPLQILRPAVYDKDGGKMPNDKYVDGTDET
jgi:hypothetical protein